MADFSQDTVSMCVCVLCEEAWLMMFMCVLLEHGCACMRAFSCHALTHPCETVMWALKFNNFRGTIGDRNLKSPRPFPQQQRKEEKKGGKRYEVLSPSLMLTSTAIWSHQSLESSLSLGNWHAGTSLRNWRQ